MSPVSLLIAAIAGAFAAGAVYVLQGRSSLNPWSGGGLPAGLAAAVRRDLLRCGPFDSDGELEAVFVDGRIAPWRDAVRDRDSRAERVDALIELLHDQQDAEGANALALFLRVLVERSDPATACHGQLEETAQQLAAWQGNAPETTPPQPAWRPFAVPAGVGLLAFLVVTALLAAAGARAEATTVTLTSLALLEATDAAQATATAGAQGTALAVTAVAATEVSDVDGDGLNFAAERAAGTNPQDADSDDDGLPDGADDEPLLAQPTATATLAATPVVVTEWVYELNSPFSGVEQVEFAAEPGLLPAEVITDFLTLSRLADVEIVLGENGESGSDYGLGYEVLFTLSNGGEQPLILDLDERFFSLVDSQGQAATLVSFCCEAKGERLSPFERREIRLVFLGRPDWYGKESAPGLLYLRVRGLLPVVRATWVIPGPAVAE